MKKQVIAASIGAALVLSTISLPGTSSATTNYTVVKSKLVHKKTKKNVKGYVQFNKKLYANGSLFTGTYKKKYYKAGVLFTGTANKIVYVKGVKLTGKKNGIRYKNGKKLTGTYAQKFYKNGLLFTGSYKGIRYTQGTLFNGYVKEKYYRNGVLFEGKMDGVLYVKGVPFNGTKDRYLYDNGLKFTGIDAKSSKAYKNGLLFTGASTWDNKRYKNGMLLNDMYNDKLYKDGVTVTGIVNGLYYVDGTIYAYAQTEKGMLYKDGLLFTGFYNGFVYENGIKGEPAVISANDPKIQIATSQKDPNVYEEHASYTFVFYDGTLFTGTYVAEDGTETTLRNGLPQNGMGIDHYVYKDGKRYYPKAPEKIGNRYYKNNRLYTGYVTIDGVEEYAENGKLQTIHIKDAAILSDTQLDVTLLKPVASIQATDVQITQNGNTLSIAAIHVSDDGKTIHIQLDAPLALGDVTMSVARATTITKSFGTLQTKTLKQTVFNKQLGLPQLEPVIVDTNGIDVTAHYASRVYFNDFYNRVSKDGSFASSWSSNYTSVNASIINEAGEVIDTFSKMSMTIFYGTFNEQATDVRATIAKEVFVQDPAAAPITATSKNTTTDFVHVFTLENNTFTENSEKSMFISMTPNIVDVDKYTGQLTYKQAGHAKIAYTTNSHSDIYFYEFDVTE